MMMMDEWAGGWPADDDDDDYGSIMTIIHDHH